MIARPDFEERGDPDHSASVEQIPRGTGPWRDHEAASRPSAHPVAADHGEQPARVHERHLAEIELDRMTLPAEALQHLDQLRGGGDVQFTVDDEQPIPAEVGDLRDLPACGA